MAFSATEKRVTVRIDGVPVAVSTHGATVADALDRVGVEVGSQDRIEPSLPTSLASGDVIEVYRAKPVVLLLDGRPRRVMVTGTTVAEVLTEISLRGTAIDSVHPSRATRVTAGMTIRYRRAAALTVVHDGRTDRVITNAASVEQVLREMGVDLGGKDRVTPALDARPTEGMRVEVIRIGYRREVRTIAVPFETILRRDPGLEYGERRMLQAGRDGSKRVVYRAKYLDGELVWRSVLRTSWTAKPVNRIIVIGSGYPGCACNRGSQVGQASWYSSADGLTAAHRTLPIGTVVRVENLANGKWVNVRIADRGPFVEGRIIDLSDEAFRRIGSLSRGVVDVRIRW